MSEYPRWTGPELELAARTGLTTLQVANAIGRTVNAVRGARRQLRIDPRKIALAGTPRPGQHINIEPSVESWGVTVDEARTILNNQTCPICRIGPWKSPLNHVSRAHGIDRLTMRDICGLSMYHKVTDPEVSAAWSANGKKRADNLAASRTKERRAPRRTLRAKESAGHGLRVHEARNPEAVAAMRAKFRERMTTPEAKAKWEESMQRVRSERVYTPEERAAFTEKMKSDDVVAKRAEYNASRRQEGCTVAECHSPHVARGFCAKHWRRWKLYGDPLGRGRIGKPPTALNQDQERQACAMIAAGKSRRAVADQFGCSPAAIGRMLKRQELT